jgi:hypothetical protein
MVDDKVSIPGYRPSVLGQDNLGWESSKTINLGFDFGFLANRISGDVNYYMTNTYDLLLARAISPIHGIPSITENIGETENRGIELSLHSRNIVKSDFQWSTSFNFSHNKNKILSLYGIMDENGEEVDDIASGWFIGQPISANYDFEWIGTWQLGEEEEAEKYDSQPGFVKLRDVDGNYTLDSEDRVFLGQQDPTFLWGMTNSFSYKNFTLNIFIHGIHGSTRANTLMTDNVTNEVRTNTLIKNWWTPENPTNEWIVNHMDAERMGGIIATGKFYENASFIRLKDVSFSYDFSSELLQKWGMETIKLYITGRNLFTSTEWTATDPEISEQWSFPIQKQYVFGLNISF